MKVLFPEPVTPTTAMYMWRILPEKVLSIIKKVRFWSWEKTGIARKLEVHELTEGQVPDFGSLSSSGCPRHFGFLFYSPLELQRISNLLQRKSI
jgi:hypothetical protein